jgi:hypothetical protein
MSLEVPHDPHVKSCFAMTKAAQWFHPPSPLGGLDLGLAVVSPTIARFHGLEKTSTDK